MPASAGLVGTVEILVAGYEPLGLVLGMYVLAVVVLCAARFAPIAVLMAIVGIYATTPLFAFEVSHPVSWLSLIGFACFGTGLHSSRFLGLVGLASVLAALGITYASLWLTGFEVSLLFGLLLMVGAWALGASLRRALAQHCCAGAVAERARVSHALAAKRAVESERERIAVELHDVLAHALGAMVVQSSVAGDIVRVDRGAAAAALHDVAQLGREALAETGRLLRLLRDDRDELGLRGSPASDVPLETARDGAGAAPAVQLRDVPLPAFLGLLASAEAVWAGQGVWATISACWLAAGVLCVRRAFPLPMPLAVTAILVGALLVGAETDELASLIPILGLAFFSAGRHARRSQAGWGLLGVVAAIALQLLEWAARGELGADTFLVLVMVAPWVVGVALRETLLRTRRYGAQIERARLEQELAADRAVAVERKRIARALHDMLANSLSVMVIQATHAADVVEVNPVAAAAAVEEVERAGRKTLAEIGRLMRLIRDGADERGTHPQPGVAEVPALAEEYCRAGLTIDLDMDGVVTLPVGVELSAYRIVQEGLTNALKHAPGGPVRVRLVRRLSGVAIEVRSGPADARTVTAVASGHGLIGLRERMSLFGGSLEARPTEDGGFVLAAKIPLDVGQE